MGEMWMGNYCDTCINDENMDCEILLTLLTGGHSLKVTIEDGEEFGVCSEYASV
jgi:hypothetical protein